MQGRIISRFSMDQGQADQEIPELMSDVLMCLFGSLGTLLMICGVLPWLILPVLPIVGVYWWLQQYYRKTSRGKRVRTTTHRQQRGLVD
jgi:hypothetical protein